jgi:hypothetical protein
MITIQAHFDGQAIIPDQPLDLPRDKTLVISIELPPEGESSGVSALDWLAENAIVDDLPEDLATEHDHYLYGTPTGN